MAHYPELLKLWVDGGFNGPEFASWVQTQHPTMVVEVVKRLADVPGFTLLSKRWVVERTFGWLMHCSRLVRRSRTDRRIRRRLDSPRIPRPMLRRRRNSKGGVTQVEAGKGSG